MQYQDYLSTTKFKAIHNFLKHYDKCKFNQFEEKPIDTIRRGNITSYKVSAQKHREYYKFENSEELVDAFLKNFRTKFNPQEKYVVIKCGFSIENLQPGPVENDSPVINMRYWSTESYRTKYFNDYILFSLKENILKSVIVNGMSRSS